MEIEFSFSRDRDAVAMLQPHLNPLPRSVARSASYLLLDGEWRFDLDLDDLGLQEQWYLRHGYGGTAEWPGTIEAQMAATANARLDVTSPPHHDVIAWYERDFTVPPSWLEEESEVQITFGACAYETRVWLNGRSLRTVEDEEAHLGEYTSFSFELPREHLEPCNRLTVRVANSLDPDRPRGKQESLVFKRGGIWYQTISGPVRSVWIEPVERNRLRSRLGVVSTIEDRLVEFRLTTRVHEAGIYRLRLVVSCLGAEEPLATEEVELPLVPGEARQHIALSLPGAELWSVTSPALHQVIAQLTSPGGQVSQIQTRFGLRKIEARGKRIYLNDQPTYLDGILYQPSVSTFDEVRRHVYGAKELGCNLLRVHIAGTDPRIYDLADELGMLLWVEVPSPHRSNASSREKHWAELQRLLVHIGPHPSVVILSLYNEDWGAEDIADSPETRAYIRFVFEYLRRHYPQFLVVGNDGWQNVSEEGRLQSSLLTVHAYQTELHRWTETLDRLVAGENEGVAVRPLVIQDPFFYRGQVPIVVSEWGGFGFSTYGGPADMDGRADRIRAFKRELTKRPIAGDVYTQATSIEDETNGLMDPHTGELFVPAGLLSSGFVDAKVITVITEDDLQMIGVGGEASS